MKTAAIIAEYNPFHNGHAYHIQKTRESGYTHIIAVMSGNFVQRGAPAVVDRFLRAESAVRCGADLVIELPLPWSSSAAKDFADGAVQIINACGLVDCLSFGCEDADLSALEMVTKDLQAGEVQIFIKQFLQKGCSYPSAVANALQATGKLQSSLFLSHPNNMLAMEYVKQIKDTSVEALAIRRIGCAHDDDVKTEHFASASYVRKELYKMYNDNLELYNLYNLMPSVSVSQLFEAIKTKKAPVDLNTFNIAAIARLQMLTVQDFAGLPFVENGLEYRLYDAVQKSVTFEQACDFAKNKQITHARIRRSLLQAVLGLHNMREMKKVPYLRILALNKNGRELLKQMQTSALLPIIMRNADTSDLDDYAMSVYNFNQQANDFYYLCLPCPQCCGFDKTRNIYVEK